MNSRRTTESDIVYESSNHVAWVKKDKQHSMYIVFVDGAIHATSDSAYAMTPDGLSVAKYRADYLDKKSKGKR